MNAQARGKRGGEEEKIWSGQMRQVFKDHTYLLVTNQISDIQNWTGKFSPDLDCTISIFCCGYKVVIFFLQIRSPIFSHALGPVVSFPDPLLQILLCSGNGTMGAATSNTHLFEADSLEGGIVVGGLEGGVVGADWTE